MSIQINRAMFGASLDVFLQNLPPTNSFLPLTQKESDLSISDKLSEIAVFAQLLADSLIGRTGSILEGYNVTDALQIFIHYFSTYTKHTEIVQELQECQKIAKKIELLAMSYTVQSKKWMKEKETLSKPELKDIPQDLVQALDEFCVELRTTLQEKGRLVFPGGWVNPLSGLGHALFYVLTLTPHNEVSITIHNKGTGYRFHPIIATDEKIKILSALSFTSIPLEHLDLAFFRRLLEPKILPCWNSGIQFDAKDCYFPICTLGGRYEQVSEVHWNELVTGQRAGTCAFKVICAYLRSKLGFREYKREHAFLKLFELFQYVVHGPDEPKLQKSHGILTRKATAKFSASLVKMHEKRLISDQEFQALSHYVAQVYKKLQDTEGDLQSTTEQSKNRLRTNFLLNAKSLEIFDSVLPSSFGVISEDFEELTRGEELRSKKDGKVMNVTAFLYPENYKRLIRFDIREPKNLKGYLLKLKEYSTKYNKRPGEIEIVISDFFATLPTPLSSEESKKECFWNQIPLEDIPAVLMHLDTFSHLLLVQKQPVISAEKRLVATLMSAAATTKLIQRKCCNKADLFIGGYDQITTLIASSHEFSDDDPMLDKKINELLAFGRDNCNSTQQCAFLDSVSFHPNSKNRSIIRFSYEHINNPEVDYIFKRLKEKNQDKTGREFLLLVASHYASSKSLDVASIPEEYYQLRRQILRTFLFVTGKASLQYLQRLYTDFFSIQNCEGKDVHVLLPCSFTKNGKKGNMQIKSSSRLSLFKRNVESSLFFLLYQQSAFVPPKINDFTLYESQKIALIRESGNLSISSMLAAFKEYLKLDSKSVQLFIDYNFFSRGILLRQLELYPQLAVEIDDWINKGKKLFKEKNDLSTELFFSYLQERLHNTLVAYLPKEARESKEQRCESLLSLLTRDTITEKWRILIYLLLVSPFEKSDFSSTKEMCCFFQNYILARYLIGDEAFISDPIIKVLWHKAREKAYSQAEDMHTALKKSPALIEQIMKECLSYLKYAKEPFLVVGQFPNYCCLQDKFKLDLLEGTLFMDGHLVEALPQEILEDEQSPYVTFFGKKMMPALCVSSKEYSVLSGNEEYKIILKSLCGKSVEHDLYKKIEGHWYKFAHSLHVIEEYDGVISLENFFGKCHYFISQEADISPHILVESKSHTIRYQIDFKQIVEGEMDSEAVDHFEITTISKEVDGERLYLLDTFQGQFKKEDDFYKQCPQRNIYELLFRLLSDGNESETENTDDKNEKVDILENYIQSWGKRTEDTFELYEISIANLGLYFDLESNSRIYCKQIPNFYIAEKQPQGPCVFLENEGGKKKALFAKAGCCKYYLSQDPLAPIAKSNASNAYIVLEVTENGFTSNSILEELIVASYYFSQDIYDKAFTALQKVVALTKSAFTIEEKEILLKSFILQIDFESNDPQDIAIRLRAAVLLITNENEFSENVLKCQIDDSIGILLESYLDCLKMVPHDFCLNKYEELILLHAAGNLSCVLTLRLNLLNENTVNSQLVYPLLDREFAPVRLTLRQESQAFKDILQQILELPAGYFVTSLSQLSALSDVYKGKEGGLQVFILLYTWAKSGDAKKRIFLEREIRFALQGSHKSILLATYLLFAKHFPEKVPDLPDLEAAQSTTKLQEFFRKLNHVGLKKMGLSSLGLPQQTTVVAGRPCFLEKVAPVIVPFPALLQEPLSCIATELTLTKIFKEIAAPKVKSASFQTKASDDRLLLQKIRGLENFVDEDRVSYTVISQPEWAENFQKIQLQLESLKTSYEAKMKTLKEEIEHLASSVPNVIVNPEDKLKLARYQIDLQTNKFPELTLARLLTLFLQEDRAFIAKCNPFLTTSVQNTLRQKIATFLQFATESQHISRLLEKQSDESDSFVKEALRQRAYKLDNPYAFYFLAFEHATSLRLYNEQSQLLQTLLCSDTDLVVQLVMGAGKTSVFSIHLAKIYANGEMLPIIVAPKPLLAGLSEFLKKTAFKVFQQPMHFLDFDIQTHGTERELMKLLKLLKMLIEKRGFLLSSPQSLQDLDLLYEQLLEEALETDISLVHDRIVLIEEILMLIEKQAVAIVDEADTVFARNKERKLAIGEFRPLAKTSISLMKEIYSILKQSKVLKIKENKQALCSAGELQEVIDDLAKKLANSKLLKIAKEEQAAFLEYVLGKTENRPNFLQKAMIHSKERAELIGFAKEVLTFILPYSLKLSANVNYGFSEKKSSVIAIPYRAANQPNEGSEFSKPEITLATSMQLYISEGLSKEKVKNWLTKLQEQAIAEYLKEKKSATQGELANTNSCHYFENKLCPQFFQKHKRGLFKIHEADYELIKDEINGSDTAVWDYFDEFVAGNVGYFEKEISADGFSLASMMKKVLGFTGMPWNEMSLPERLKVISGTDVEAKACALIMSPEKNTRCFVKNLPAANRNYISFLFQDGLLGRYNAFIDCGAYYKGVPNEQVARQILTHPQSRFQAVVFFGTKDDKKYICLREKSAPILLSDYDGTVALEDRFVFYDQVHAFGMDIDHWELCQGLISVDVQTLFKDFLQGGYRLRNYEKGRQRFDMLLSQEVARIIELSEKSVTVESTLIYMLKQQVLKQKEDAFSAVQQRIENRQKHLCKTKLLLTSMKEKVRLWDEVRVLFVREKNKLSNVAFSACAQAMNPLVALQMHKREKKEQISQDCRMYQELVDIVDKVPLPDVMSLPSVVLKGVRRDYDSQQEVQNQIIFEVQKDIEIKTNELSPRIIRESDWLCDDLPYDANLFQAKFLRKNSPGTEKEPVFAKLKDKEDGFSCFDSRIVYSPNFHNRAVARTSSFHPSQPLAQFICFFENREMKRVICLENFDADLLMMHLKKEISPALKNVKQKICLYNLDTNSICCQAKFNEFHVDSQELASDEDAQTLFLQVKLFNAQIDYSDIELILIEKWLKTVDQVHVRMLFEEKLMMRFPEHRNKYEQSALKKVLHNESGLYKKKERN